MEQKLIEKYLNGTALPKEREEVFAWIEENEENGEIFSELRKLYDITVWNATYSSKQNKRFSLSFWQSFAAIFLLLLSLGTAVFLFSREKLPTTIVDTVTCPQGQRLELALSDGTKVWLNSNSTLNFSTWEDFRTVELNGEAYFEVAYDPKRPFIVKTHECDITVLGTTFEVMSYEESNLFECSLIEGKISLKSHYNDQEIIMSTDEKVLIKNGVITRSKIEEDEEFLWRNGICSFKNQPLSTVFEQLALLHEVTINLENPEIGLQMCTGKFRNKDGIDHILSILQKNYQFNCEKDDLTNTYTIQ